MEKDVSERDVPSHPLGAFRSRTFHVDRSLELPAFFVRFDVERSPTRNDRCLSVKFVFLFSRSIG